MQVMRFTQVMDPNLHATRQWHGCKTLSDDWLCVLPYFSSLLITTITNVFPPLLILPYMLSSLALKFCWVYHKKKIFSSCTNKKDWHKSNEDYLLWQQQMFSNLFQFFLLCYVLLALKVLQSLHAKKTQKKEANQFLKFCKLKIFGTWNPID